MLASWGRVHPRTFWRSFSSTRVYDPHTVEAKWQQYWSRHPLPATRSKEKMYVLSMFPYPSGSLHMGHVRVYTLSDCLSRVYRMQGKAVIHPMGWDAFGLPAENAAIDRGLHPAAWTESNISNMKAQMMALGCQFDWEREVTTCSKHFYKWTQWLFLQLLKHGYAYQKPSLVNWDPVDCTVLANEQVDHEGRSWRSGAVVERKFLTQWFFRITGFAEALDKDLDLLDGWPQHVKDMQKNWIGKTHGAYVKFRLKNSDASLKIYTTRPDTLFGVTYIALSPEHPWLQANNLLSTKEQEAVANLQQALVPMSDADRAADTQGLRLGITCINPLSGKELPVYVATYVLAGVGTGAVMGVPAHDPKDWRFAHKHAAEVVTVVEHKGELPCDLRGTLQASGRFSGLSSDDAHEQIVSELQRLGAGEATFNFKIADWLVSRQRYWGTPIPVVHCSKCGVVPLPEADLPLELPAAATFCRGGSYLQSEEARAWREVPCPSCRQPATRETDTLDTFVDSSWYYYRYLSPELADRPFSIEAANALMPVDVYVGGIEHAILHLLYARFITKFLHSQGFTQHVEPFKQLLNQGMVHGVTYIHPTTKAFVPPQSVTTLNGEPYYLETVAGEQVQTLLTVGSAKMSKSKYNGVDPQVVLQEHGADAARLYILFAAPPTHVLEWGTGSRVFQGTSRYLGRVCDLVQLATPPQQTLRPESQDLQTLRSNMNLCIKAVTANIEARSIHKAVSDLHTFTNQLTDFASSVPEHRSHEIYHQAVRVLLLLLHPMAPHVTAELWTTMTYLQHSSPSEIQLDIRLCDWPSFSAAHVLQPSCVVQLQIQGKFKRQLEVDSEIASDPARLETFITQHPSFQSWVGPRGLSRLMIPKRSKEKVVVNLIVNEPKRTS